MFALYAHPANAAMMAITSRGTVRLRTNERSRSPRFSLAWTVRLSGMPIRDTSAAANEHQLELYRLAGPQRRGEIAAELSEAIRELARDGVRLRHPEFNE